jgi:hypothetical protein
VPPQTKTKPRQWLRWAVALVVLIVLAVLSGMPFVAPGHPTSPDVWSHLVRQQVFYQSLVKGHSPFYSFMFYSGYPHLRFYGFVLPGLGALVMLMTKAGAVGSMKLLLFALHLLSVLAMFLYLRRRVGSVLAASLGSAVYAVVPWRVFYLAIVANLPQSLIYVFLPLAFMALDRMAETRSHRPVLLAGLWLGLAMLSHPFSASYTAAFMFLFALFAALGSPLAERRGLWLRFGLALVLAFAVSCALVLPFIVEYRSHVYPGASITFGRPDLRALLWPWARAGGYSGSYLGLSAVALAIAGVAVVAFERGRARSETRAAVGIGLALLLALVVPALPVVRDVLTGGLPAVRFLIFFVFLAGILAASAFAWLERRVRSGIVVLATFLVVAGVLGADCLPRLLHIRYDETQRFRDVRTDASALVRSEQHGKVLDCTALRTGLTTSSGCRASRLSTISTAGSPRCMGRHITSSRHGPCVTAIHGPISWRPNLAATRGTPLHVRSRRSPCSACRTS